LDWPPLGIGHLEIITSRISPPLELSPALGLAHLLRIGPTSWISPPFELATFLISPWMQPTSWIVPTTVNPPLEGYYTS
jgi:hypothetical protein